MQTVPVDEPRVWDIGDLNRRARLAVVREFRGPIWVSGELTRADERRASRWLELVERGGGRDGRDAHLRAFCSATRWARIEQKLAAAGAAIQVGQRLVVVGTIEVGDRGDLSLEVNDVDVAALVGDRLLARQRLMARLAAEDLVGANGRLVLVDLPLRVGVVTSAGSDGHRDLLRQLDSSGFAFQVLLRAVPVEGPQAPGSIRAALATFGPGDVDLAVIVRGGGTKASLDVFDSDAVARAVATAAVPVWTGIGHSRDRTVTDEVAHRCCATPTEVGQALAALVGGAWAELAGRGVRVGELVARRLAAAGDDLDGRRRHLSSLVRSQLHAHRSASVSASATLARAARRCLDERSRQLVLTAADLRGSGGSAPAGPATALAEASRRLQREVERHLAAGEEQARSRRVVLGAYDPRRQLERGWTLTHTVDGRLARRAAVLEEGDTLVTTFADGTTTSTVTRVHPGYGQ